MHFDPIGFGNRLREVRKERGLTQEQLAERAGLSTHYVGNIEQAVRNPSLTSIIQICAALGITPDRLFADSISKEMLAGICLSFSDEHTLREVAGTLSSLFGDTFPFDDDDSPCLWGMPIPKEDQAAPKFVSLADDLLSFPE